MSVGVPGTLRAWQKALRRVRHAGRCASALQPGIAAAQHGFTVDQTFFNQTDEAKAIFADFPATAALYLDPDGSPRDVGTVIRNPDLARTYALIARKGPDALYSGPLAQAIVDTVKHPPLRPGSTRVGAPRRHGALATSRAYKAIDRDPTHDRLPRPRRLRHGAAVQRRLDRRRDPQHPRGLSGPRHDAARARAAPLPRGLAPGLRRPRRVRRPTPATSSVPLAQLLSDQFAAQRRAPRSPRPRRRARSRRHPPATPAP